MAKGKITVILPKHQAKGFDRDPAHARQGAIMRNKAGEFYVVTYRRLRWTEVNKRNIRSVFTMYLKPQELHTLAADMSKPSIRIPIAELKQRGWVRVTERLI